jgi:uncharacterized protein with GYD domain
MGLSQFYYPRNFFSMDKWRGAGVLQFERSSDRARMLERTLYSLYNLCNLKNVEEFMSTFFMFGKYSAEAIKGISAARTEKASKVISDNGGSLTSAYALLGDYDLVLIVELPGIEEAMRTSLALNKLTGISFSTASAVTVEQFDKLAARA